MQPSAETYSPIFSVCLDMSTLGQTAFSLDLCFPLDAPVPTEIPISAGLHLSNLFVLQTNIVFQRGTLPLLYLKA